VLGAGNTDALHEFKQNKTGQGSIQLFSFVDIETVMISRRFKNTFTRVKGWFPTQPHVKKPEGGILICTNIEHRITVGNYWFSWSPLSPPPHPLSPATYDLTWPWWKHNPWLDLTVFRGGYTKEWGFSGYGSYKAGIKKTGFASPTSCCLNLRGKR